MNRNFLPPLLGEEALPDQETQDAYAIAFADPAVAMLVNRCCAALDRLAKEAGFLHFLRLSVEGGCSEGQTPAEWLTAELARIEEERTRWRQELAVSDARHRAARERTSGLRAAVSNLSMKAQAERDGVQRALDAISNTPISSPGSSRYSRLKEAGLSDSQIEALGERSGDERKADLVARRAEAEQVLTQCGKFARDPLLNVAHLAGLGLDQYIAAYQASAVNA